MQLETLHSMHEALADMPVSAGAADLGKQG